MVIKLKCLFIVLARIIKEKMQKRFANICFQFASDLGVADCAKLGSLGLRS